MQGLLTARARPSEAVPDLVVTLEAALSTLLPTAHPPEQSSPTPVSHSSGSRVGSAPVNCPGVWGAAQPLLLPFISQCRRSPCLNSRAYQHLHHPRDRPGAGETSLLQPPSWLLQSTEAPGLATHPFSGHRGAQPSPNPEAVTLTHHFQTRAASKHPLPAPPPPQSFPPGSQAPAAHLCPPSPFPSSPSSPAHVSSLSLPQFTQCLQHKAEPWAGAVAGCCATF